MIHNMLQSCFWFYLGFFFVSRTCVLHCGCVDSCVCVCACAGACARVWAEAWRISNRARGATATGSGRSCAGVSVASARRPRRRPGRFAQWPPHVDWEDLFFHWAALRSLWEAFRLHWAAYLQKRHLASSRVAKASRVRNLFLFLGLPFRSRPPPLVGEISR